MASDGSQPVEWSGNAFSYLLHHPNFVKTETYASKRPSSPRNHQTSVPNNARHSDRVGTWNGPAPQGYTNQPTHAKDESQPAIQSTSSSTSLPPTATTTMEGPQPDHVILPGGASMPLLGLGTYKVDDPDAVYHALSIGYRHIDCARAYGNEDIVGQGIATYLKSLSSSSEEARQSLWITSKVWNDAHRAAAVQASAEQTLEDLGVDYLDLLLIHWPEAWIPGTKDIDSEVTLKETWQAMESLVDQGKVKYIGVSNFGLRLLEELMDIARIKPVVNQIELHPLVAQRKMVGVCMRKGVTCVGYSPLGHSKNDLLEHPVVVKIAEELKKTPAQVLLRWNVQRGVGVIPKASSKEHLFENLDGLYTWRLRWDHKAELDKMDEGRRLCLQDWHEWEDAEEGGAVKPSTVLLG